MAADVQPLRLSPMGEAAILCQTAGPLAQDTQERFWALADAIGRRPDVLEAVVGMNNLLVVFDPSRTAPEGIESMLADLWVAVPPRETTGRIVEIEITYNGMDLAEVARHCGLAPEDYARRHAAGLYTVFALGSMPGFGYLAGLDPALAVPRRETPRTAVEAGSVIIGGAQTGVMPCAAPSGWHILGRATVPLFDPAADPPTRLAPGDRVRFVVTEERP